MEYMQAILIVFSHALRAYGFSDVLYLMGAFALLWYLIRGKGKALMQITVLYLIIVLYTVLVQFISVGDQWKGVSTFLIHMLCNVSLLVFVFRNRWKWMTANFIWAVSLIQGAETIVAMFMKDSNLFWKVSEYQDGVTLNRLKLLYEEPAYLSFICGIMLLVYVYPIILRRFSWKLLAGAIICLIDMALSNGLGGMIACTISVIVMLAGYVVVHREKLQEDFGSRIRWMGALAVVVLTIGGIVILFPIYGSRIFGMTQGSDTGFMYNLQSPIRNLYIIMEQTRGRGVGIGQLVGSDIGNQLGIHTQLNNSFVNFFAECGTCGIVFVGILIVCLFAMCMVYGSSVTIALFLYLMIYQCAAGRFDDPVIWFFYGWIAASCSQRRERVKEELEAQPPHEEKKDVVCAIIGAKGLANYGGYETFVDKLTEYHMDNSNIHYLIACKANGKGAMDETKLKGAVPVGPNEFLYHNAYCFKLKLPSIGSAQAIVYDVMAAMYAIDYFKKHHTEKPILYILTCRIGPFIDIIAKMVHDLGGEYYVNPDGHEWKRSVWSPKVRMYWKMSERLMIRKADLVICDSKNIESYIKETYSKYKPKTTYIAYGAEMEQSQLQDTDPKFAEWLKTYNIKNKEYYLIVGRFVPENNYEFIIKEFMKSTTKRELVIITNINKSFMDELERKLHFVKDRRIKFVGTVYDQELLKKIRENAFAYFHGHEVGGTNPSLIEALSSTRLNMLLNVGFNRECGEDGALYWEKEAGSLCALIDKAETMTTEQIDELSMKAKKRVKEAYSWGFIADQYEKVLLEN